MNLFNAQTRFCLSIANPNRSTLSPLMHNAGFRELGLNIGYLAVEPSEDQLSKVIEAIIPMGILGCSVSKPFKQKVIPYLDELDESAREIGAVNTIHNRGDRLVGLNTDWIGVNKALEEHGDLQGARVVVLGAGGAARAIIWGLKRAGAQVRVFNRTKERAIELCDAFSVVYGGTLVDLDPSMDYDILINAIPIGGKGSLGQMAVPEGFIKPKTLVLDELMIPRQTRLLQEAERVGAIGIPGIRVLLFQGLPQFSLFTGREAPVESMYQILDSTTKDWLIGDSTNA